MRHRAHVLSLVVGALVLTACNSSGLPVAPTNTPSLLTQATPTTLAMAPRPIATTGPRTTQPTPTASILGDSTPAVGATSQAQATTAPGGTARPGATTQAGNAVLDKEIAQVEKDTVITRGLKPLGDVPETFLNPAQMHDNLVKDLQDNYSPAEAKQDAAELWLLRLVKDPSIDLYQLQADLLSEQVLGYYDPKKKDLFVLNTGGNQDLTPASRQTLAHEFTHALQDQHFDLEKLLPDKSKDDDRSLAIRALVEGDATLSGLSYARDYFTPKEKQQFLQENSSGSTAVLDKAPAYLRESLFFPYDAGPDFVNQLLQIKGFQAVDKALADPPTSSEQIMHPEKYINQPRDMPVPVALQPLTDTLGAGWTIQDFGTLGEFDLKVQLQENGASNPTEGAAGWGGGSYAFYTNGGKSLVVQNTVWDNQQEAEEFQTALEQTFSQAQKSGSFYVDGGRYFSLQASGKTVNLIASNDRAALQRATR